MADQETWDDLAAARQVHLRYWLKRVDSPASVKLAEAWLESSDAYSALARRWDGLLPAEREAAAEQLNSLMRQAAYATRPFCRRCGSCCDNAGPTLYPGDEQLLEQGVLLRRQLHTVRRGEQVFSHWKGGRVVLEHELVMVVPGADGACLFHDRSGHACTIHQLRPRQCRAQQCWDTAGADELLLGPGLTRLDLLPPGDPLAALVQEHERSCPPARLRELASAHQAGDPAAAPPLLKLVQQDRRARREALERHQLPPRELPFLLGRPLEQMLAGLTVETDPRGQLQLAGAPDRDPAGAPDPDA